MLNCLPRRTSRRMCFILCAFAACRPPFLPAGFICTCDVLSGQALHAVLHVLNVVGTSAQCNARGARPVNGHAHDANVGSCAAPRWHWAGRGEPQRIRTTRCCCATRRPTTPWPMTACACSGGAACGAKDALQHMYSYGQPARGVCACRAALFSLCAVMSSHGPYVMLCAQAAQCTLCETRDGTPDARLPAA